MIALGAGMKEGGLSEGAMVSTLLGVSFAGAFLVCFSAWLLPYLKKVITPTVSGVVVMLIGLSLVHVGIADFGGGFGAKADGTFGSMENLGLASLVLLIVLVFNCMKNPLLRMSGIAVGLIAGYIVALFLGKVDFPHCKTCRRLRCPYRLNTVLLLTGTHLLRRVRFSCWACLRRSAI